MIRTHRIEASAILQAFAFTLVYVGTIAGFMFQVARAAGVGA